MKPTMDRDQVILETLAALIAHSPIVVPRLAKPAEHLPAGYDEVDLAILEWIATEGRRAGRHVVRM